MSIVQLHGIIASLARLIGIWYITDDMPPQKVVDEAIKKWGSASGALEQLLRGKSARINVLFASCILWRRIEPGHPLSATQTIQVLLERLPSQIQPDVLALVTNNDISSIALFLTRLSHPVPTGLIPV